MPDLTPRLQLKKPVADGSETADLRVWVGENMDLLDVAIGHVEDKADAAGQAAATAQQTANAAQQAASAAQAAADAAQETADTALSTAQAAGQAASSANTAISGHVNASSAHPASAITITPAGTITATTVQDAINELDSEKAGKGTANTFTAKQTFAAGVQLGNSNNDLIDMMGLLVPLGTHTKQVTAWDPSFPEKPKTIQIKDGSTVLATIDVTSRNSEGKVAQLQVTQGDRTRVWTISWTEGREFPDSITVS